MGLDNGIEIKNYSQEAFNKFPKEWIHTYGSVYPTTYIEPVYMRKWWGVRDDIVNYLEQEYKSDKIDNGVWDLTINDLETIKDIYINWLDEEKWIEYGHSIWNWKESNIAGQIGNFIANINKIIQIIEEHPTILVEFYDCY